MKTTPAQAAPLAAPAATLIPQEIFDAVAINAEWDRKSSEIEAAEHIGPSAQSALTEALKTTDLTDTAALLKLATLKAQVDFAPLKAQALTAELEASKKTFNEKRLAAAHLVNKACVQAARGHIEVAARAVEKHFGNIDAARGACTEVPEAVRWTRSQIQFGYGEAPDAARTLKLAEEVFPEVEKLRAQLGGEIPNDSFRP